MSVYNLPDLTNSRIAAGGDAERGRWLAIEDLDALADDLKIDHQSVRLHAIKSIPDAWAHLRLFAQALIRPPAAGKNGAADSPGHEAYDHVRDEWRGLLALFALQPFYAEQYRLSITRLDLPAPVTDPDAPAAAPAPRHNALFRSTMDKLAPTATLDPAAGEHEAGANAWKESGLLLIHPLKSGGGFGSGVPIGFLSPLTLVASVRAPAATRGLKLPWVTEKGGVVDPLACRGLSPDAFQALTDYIDRLTEHVASQTPARQFEARRDLLVEELRKYKAACEARSAGALPLKPHQLDLAWPRAFFKPLGAVFDIDPAKLQRAASDCRVALRPLPGTAGALIQGMILVDPHLADTLGRDPSAVRVWERYTLADAARAEVLNDIRQSADGAGYLVVTPDDLLTQRLVSLSDGSTLHGHSGSTRQALLPLTPLALLIGEASELDDATTLAEMGSEHAFTLSLTIEGAPRPHPLHRSYGAGDTMAFEGPDDLAIWPSFERTDWPWSFLRFQYNPKTELGVRFGASARMIALDVRQSSPGTAAAKAKSLRDWASNTLLVDSRVRAGQMSQLTGVVREDTTAPEPIFRRFQFARLPDLIGEQQHLPLGVEAIFFATGERGAEQAVGCALVRRDVIGGDDRPATISIDFGSTNTIAYWQQDGGKPEQLSFGERLYRPVTVPNEETKIAEQGAAYTNFFPPAEHASPFPTILKKRELKGSAGDLAISDPGGDALGLKHMIFFNPGLSDTPTSDVMEWMSTGHLLPDIKWQKGQTRLTKEFLQQTMVMSAAELVSLGYRLANIDWRLSYPQSFGVPRVAQFKIAVADALDGVAARGKQAQFKTEGEAAAHYFMRHNDNSRLLVMLDIGGSTTDVALRFDGRLVWRGSARIAGRNFFTSYLTANPTLLGDIDQAVGASLTQSYHDKPLPPGLVELLLGSPSFVKKLDQQHTYSAEVPVWAGLRYSVTAAIGGLLYYVGMTLRGLIGKGLVPDLDDAALRDVQVAFGGRGAHSLLRFRDEGRLDGMLKLLAYGARSDVVATRMQARFSEQPKHEVAHGLLEARVVELSEPSSYLPLGEALEYRRPTHATFDAFTDLADLPGAGATPVGFEPTQLLDFLEGLKQFTSVAIALDGGADGAGGALAIVRRKTEAALRDYRRETATDGTAADAEEPQPPFLLALGNLVELLAGSEQSRVQKLSVSGE